MDYLLKAKELREARARIHAEMIALLDGAEGESRVLNDEESAKWDRMHKEMETKLTEAVRFETMADQDAAIRAQSVPGQDDDDGSRGGDTVDKEKRYSAVFNRYVRGGIGLLEPSDLEILQYGNQEVTPEMRAQSIGTESAGGYLVPEDFSAQIDVAMAQFGGMFEAADVFSTDTGADLPWPTVNDTAQTGELVSENTATGDQDVTYGVVTLGGYMYSSKIVLVSIQLLQDSFFNMDAHLSLLLGERLGRITNTHATTGTGSGQPKGVVVASTAGHAAASSSALTHDELLDLKHSVDPAYRRQPGVRWMFNDATLKALKKLKDGDNRPLWAPGIAVKEPDTLDSDPFTVNQDMASMEASAKTVLYGDFKKYKIRQIRGITLMRLTERYAEKFQVGFIAFRRLDGDLIDAGTNPIKHIVHPAS